MSAIPILGVKMGLEDAKAYVDALNKKVIQRWQERVTNGPFMTKFLEGNLSPSAIRLFFKNWGNFTVEINTLIAASYHKHIGFFKRHADLLGPLGAKIADEFIHPKPPGHVLVMLQTAEALGLTRDEILREPMLPECRAILDFKRGLLWEGTVAEWWFSMLTEEPIGHWAAAWFKTLTTKYGFTKQQAVYFSTHEEADLKEKMAELEAFKAAARLMSDNLQKEMESRNKELEEIEESPFKKSFSEFLKNYGHLSESVVDLMFPRWEEDPTPIFKILRAHLASDDKQKLGAEKFLSRDEARAKVNSYLKNRSKLFLFKKWRFGALLKLATKYVSLRENFRFHIPHALFRMRLLFLRQGQILKEHGYLEEENEVFFLYPEEIEKALTQDLSQSDPRYQSS